MKVPNEVSTPGDTALRGSGSSSGLAFETRSPSPRLSTQTRTTRSASTLQRAGSRARPVPPSNACWRSTPRGARVLDLGTHIGSFTLAAAAMGYEVIGVEASPQNAFLLRASLERNGFDRVDAGQCGGSDRPGLSSFPREGHTVTWGCRDQVITTVSVPAVRIDDLMAERGWDRVDFLKMDIEGRRSPASRECRGCSRVPRPAMLLVESNGHTLNFFNKTPSRPRRRRWRDSATGTTSWRRTNSIRYGPRTFSRAPAWTTWRVKRPLADLTGYRVNGPLAARKSCTVSSSPPVHPASPSVATSPGPARGSGASGGEGRAGGDRVAPPRSLRRGPSGGGRDILPWNGGLASPDCIEGWRHPGPVHLASSRDTSSRSKTNQS